MKHPAAVIGALILSAFGIVSWAPRGARAQVGTCAGDCNHDDRVTIDELVSGVNIALGTMPVDRCPAVDPDGDDRVTVAELIAVVSVSLAGCDSHTNHAPVASDVSLGADASTSYVEKQLIGSDPDGDTLTYELTADPEGTGYEFAYVNPESGVLYLTLSADFQGTIVLPYRVTDGRLFSNAANATVEVQAQMPSQNTGLNGVDPKQYASYPRGFYNGDVLGAPGVDPTLPSSVDLSKDFPLPGNQGNQYSCVGWATAYAIKSYQERVEIGWSLEPVEHRFSPAYIYNQINHGQDHGSWLDEALNLVVDQGVATLDQTPYNDHDYFTQPTDAARQEASQYKGLRWKTVNGILEIKDALANHLPILAAIWVYGDLPRLRGPDSVYNTFGGGLQGKHAIAITGYDDQRYGGALRIINSWGPVFGDGGYFWLPYTMANQVINTDEGPQPVLIEAYVLEDMHNTTEPPPDPVDPPPAGALPDLQVTNWNANFNGTPGGSGSLTYTVTNTGTATANAGANVALTVSRDPNFTTGNTLVVYERIPFDMAPGTTAYRDANNSIAFKFPYDLEPGQYYMAFKVDIFNDVAESNEGDNFSPSTTVVDIVNTLPDMEVVSWYSTWDELGLGTLTYNVVNSGESVAPKGWQIALALSPNNIFGDGNETLLFSEPANFDVSPGGTLYRDDASAAGFSLYFDTAGKPVPDGVYYIALWLDPTASLAESNEFNNASVSWGTVSIGVTGLSAAASAPSADTSSATPASAYNGKVLPARQDLPRSVRISTTSEGRRQAEFLSAGVIDDGGPRLKTADALPWSKTARAAQQVIFPVTEMKPMPSAD